MTARDMIASVLRLGGVLSAGEEPSASEASDALSAFNQMLSQWSTENLAIYQNVREEFSLTQDTATYTWGTGGDFDSSRPIEIIKANIEIQGTDPQEIPLHILTTKEYADISLKETGSTYPNSVYFDGSHPLLGVTFWPVPSESEKVVFYTLKPFSELTLNTDLSYPPGYEKAIRFNLWVDLCPEYGRALDPVIMQQAMVSKANIKRKNSQSRSLKIDVPVSTNKNSFDYRIGE